MYQQAAFCLEELLLHQPTDVGRHLLLADALYTMGGAHNWRAARTQYSGNCAGLGGWLGAGWLGLDGWMAVWVGWVAGRSRGSQADTPLRGERPGLLAVDEQSRVEVVVAVGRVQLTAAPCPLPAALPGLQV